MSGDDEMVVVARVVLLVAGSANKPDEEGASSVSAAGGKEGESGSSSSSSIEHGDIMQALSGAHLREVGIAIKEARPGWQEAHVQVCLWMCVCVCVCVCVLFVVIVSANRLSNEKASAFSGKQRTKRIPKCWDPLAGVPQKILD